MGNIQCQEEQLGKKKETQKSTASEVWRLVDSGPASGVQCFPEVLRLQMTVGLPGAAGSLGLSCFCQVLGREADCS